MNPYQHALQRFTKLFDRALKSGIEEPTAVSLSTCGPDGQPSIRIVLLKGFDENGFVFFTNYESRKSLQIQSNPKVALCFYWDELNTQIQIEGSAEVISKEESDEYWATRPRKSQIGAWASEQSRPLKDRATLLARVAKFTARFRTGTIPRPDHWGGYRVVPVRIEFWTKRSFRLHDRVVYWKEDDEWKSRRLFP